MQVGWVGPPGRDVVPNGGPTSPKGDTPLRRARVLPMLDATTMYFGMASTVFGRLVTVSEAGLAGGSEIGSRYPTFV